MAGVYQLEIVETIDELRKLLRVQKTASDKERIQLLYLLKSEQVKTIAMAANLLGRHRVTLQKWLNRYRKGGIENLLAHKPRTGRKQSIPKWAQKVLEKQLQQEQGFQSYSEICQWLSSQLGIESNYKTVHKPKGKVQWQFKATYLYGIVEPKTGEHFFYEFSHLNSDCFQVFLNLISQHFADSILILQLDQAGCHRAKKLKIPSNIIFLFQLSTQLESNSSWKATVHSAPSHSPETNPIETVWQHLKRGLRWQLPKTLDELRELISNRLAQMSQQVIHSIVGRKSILNALNVAGI